jgi:hypothetical protein
MVDARQCSAGNSTDQDEHEKQCARLTNAFLKFATSLFHLTFPSHCHIGLTQRGARVACLR